MEIGLSKPTAIKRFCGVSKRAAITKSNFLKSYVVYKSDLEIASKINWQFRDFINLYQKQYHLITEEHYSIENLIDEVEETRNELEQNEVVSDV